MQCVYNNFITMNITTAQESTANKCVIFREMTISLNFETTLVQ